MTTVPTPEFVLDLLSSDGARRPGDEELTGLADALRILDRDLQQDVAALGSGDSSPPIERPEERGTPMTRRAIKAVTVEYDDGTSQTYMGVGACDVVRAAAGGGGSPVLRDTDVSYVTATITYERPKEPVV